MNVQEYMIELGENARAAARLVAKADTRLKNQALLAMADAIDSSRPELHAANAIDLDNGRNNGLDSRC